MAFVNIFKAALMLVTLTKVALRKHPSIVLLWPLKNKLYKSNTTSLVEFSFEPEREKIDLFNDKYLGLGHCINLFGKRLNQITGILIAQINNEEHTIAHDSYIWMFLIHTYNKV